MNLEKLKALEALNALEAINLTSEIIELARKATREEGPRMQSMLRAILWDAEFALYNEIRGNTPPPVHRTFTVVPEEGAH